MMFSEFQQATGCRDNNANHILFNRLEIIYMNDDTVSKDDIYAMGRALMDNTPTPEEIELRERITAEIAEHKRTIEALKSQLEYHKDWVRLWKEDNPILAKMHRQDIRNLKDLIAQERKQIAGLKFVINV